LAAITFSCSLISARQPAAFDVNAWHADKRSTVSGTPAVVDLEPI
jgi:hypothetical protein